MQYAQIKGLPNVGMNIIFTGNGVSELINLCMQGLLNDGDEILIPLLRIIRCGLPEVNLSGETCSDYICDEQSEWYPDMEDIRKK